MSRRARHRRRITFLAWAAALGGVVSCVLAEPPTDLPRLPLTRPTILHGSVVPSTSSVLGVFPDTFEIPVELSDPSLAFEWSFFVDYNPRTGDGLALPVGTSTFSNDPAIQQGRIRKLVIPATPPTDLDVCHVIEVVVALRMEATLGASAHTPAEPGGDNVIWFFSPDGDFRGCPGLDAGRATDAGADARDGEGGGQ